MTRPVQPIVCPFTVIVDSREQAAWGFGSLAADAKQRYRPLVVRTKVAALPTGDYSIEGLEDQVTIERKSLEDAFGTFGGDRQRWERELERMAAMQWAAVIVEASWSQIFASERRLSEKHGRCFSAKMMYRSVIAWQQRVPNVHWWFCTTRLFAERTALRMLWRFWQDLEKEQRHEG